MSERDPKSRFSSRVENYVKYRPPSPAAAIDLLKRECGLLEESVTADIGSGTGRESRTGTRSEYDTPGHSVGCTCCGECNKMGTIGIYCAKRLKSAM